MQQNTYQSRYFTIPNLLSLVRLLLIPLFIWLYCACKEHIWSAVVVATSGLTDVLDGHIARKYHMESNLGRILDPAADKLTQMAMCLAMVYRYPIMLWVLIFFGVKEFFLALLGYFYMRRTGIVNSARWYGKASSIVQYATMPGADSQSGNQRLFRARAHQPVHVDACRVAAALRRVLHSLAAPSCARTGSGDASDRLAGHGDVPAADAFHIPADVYVRRILFEGCTA